MKRISTLFLIMSLAAGSAAISAAEKTPHNPTGDDKVESGWKSGGCGKRGGCDTDDKQPKPSTNTETTEKYGKEYLEKQLQGTDEPKVNRTY